MKLTASGIVKIEGCNATYTEHGQWAVSRNGKHLGYVDTLTEVPTLLKKRKEEARRELARVEKEASQRKLAQESGLSLEMIRAHNITEVTW